MNNCIKPSKGSIIRIKEKKRAAAFPNPQKAPHLIGKIDGCLVKEGIRADYFVADRQTAVLVELKGCNISHACKQLLAAATHSNVAPHLKGLNLNFLIICSRFPKDNTAVQRAKDAVHKKYGGRFRVASNERMVDLSTLKDC